MLAEDNRLVDSVEVTDEKVYIIHLKSVFDASTVDEFEHVLNYLLSNDHYRFVIDLAQVEFISSAGWGVFVGELQRIRDNAGDIKLAVMSKEVYEVYLLLELDLFIQAYEVIEDALEDFSNNVLGVPKMTNAAAATAYEQSDAFPEMEEVATSSIDPAVLMNEVVNEEALDAGGENTNHVDTATIEEIEISDPWMLESNHAHLAQQHVKAPQAELADRQPAHESAEHDLRAGPRTNTQPRPPVQQPLPPNLTEPAQVTTARFAETSRAIDVEPSIQPGLKEAPPASRPARPMQPPAPQKAPGENKGGGFFDLSFFSGEDVEPEGDDDTNDYAYNHANDFAETANISLSELSGDPVLEKIISVVIAHPSYGPSAIRKMLINLNLINESITRSDIYRKLSEVNLSTRAKRIAFAITHAV